MRKRNVYFFERQHFRQWWLWAIMVGLNLLFIGGFILQIIFNKPFGNNPMSDAGLIITTGIFLLLSIYLLSGSLKTFINSDGVYIRFSPFHVRYKFYDWRDIDSVQIRRYNPLREFGGWGIRFGKHGTKAYNVSGKIGVEFFFKNGKSVLIGTNQPDYLKTVLKQLGKMEHKNDG